MAQKSCPYCNKSIKTCNFERHVNSCQKEKPVVNKINEDWKIGESYKCPNCDKVYSKKGIATHIFRMHTEKGINLKNNENRIAWNKGLDKKDPRILKISNTFKENNPNGTFLGKTHSKESKLKMSAKKSLFNSGGKCKYFETTNPNNITFKVQGTWELKFSKVLNVIDENWMKIGIGNKVHSFLWKDLEGTEHYYTPDFWSPKLKKYFEVKGYLRDSDALKMKYVIEQNPSIVIEMVRKADLNQYLKLVNIQECV